MIKVNHQRLEFVLKTQDCNYTYTLAKNDHSINFHSSADNLLHICFFS